MSVHLYVWLRQCECMCEDDVYECVCVSVCMTVYVNVCMCYMHVNQSILRVHVLFVCVYLCIPVYMSSPVNLCIIVHVLSGI